MNKPIDLAIKAAKEAAALIASKLGKSPVFEKGSSFNLVTQADTEAEALIWDILKEGLPESLLLAEEAHSSQNMFAPKLWIVDPMDGTNNFAHCIPHFSVSIAYAESGLVKAAVVYDVSRGELFSAEIGRGAYLNGEKISVSTRAKLSEAMVAMGFYYDRGEILEKTLQAIHDLFKSNIQGIRRFGSAALDLCWVACGRYDAYFEYMLSPWDYAAGMLILQEAGGVITDREGNEFKLDSRSVICSNGLFHGDLLGIIRWSGLQKK